MLYTDAAAAYIAGAYASALVAAHATCERELAGWVDSLGAAAPARAKTWGLGALTAYAEQQSALPPDLIALLFEVNEQRKLLAHFKDGSEPGTLWRRALAAVDSPDRARFEQEVDRLLAEDAAGRRCA